MSLKYSAGLCGETRYSNLGGRRLRTGSRAWTCARSPYA